MTLNAIHENCPRMIRKQPGNNIYRDWPVITSLTVCGLRKEKWGEICSHVVTCCVTQVRTWLHTRVANTRTGTKLVCGVRQGTATLFCNSRQDTSCKIWGFHGGDYEECRLLGYKTPVRTSQETHYVSATESSQLMLCKIWGFYGGDWRMSSSGI
jgi:hypothetical protein